MTNSEWISVESPPPEKGVYVVLATHISYGTTTEYVAMYSNKPVPKWSSSLYGHSRSERITHWRGLMKKDLERFSDSVELFKEEIQEWIRLQVNA